MLAPAPAISSRRTHSSQAAARSSLMSAACPSMTVLRIPAKAGPRRVPSPPQRLDRTEIVAVLPQPSGARHQTTENGDVQLFRSDVDAIATTRRTQDFPSLCDPGFEPRLAQLGGGILHLPLSRVRRFALPQRLGKSIDGKDRIWTD